MTPRPAEPRPLGPHTERSCFDSARGSGTGTGGASAYLLDCDTWSLSGVFTDIGDQHSVGVPSARLLDPDLVQSACCFSGEVGIRLEPRVLEHHAGNVAQRWHIFDARQPVEELAEQIAHELAPWLDHIQTLEPTPL